MNEWLFVFVMLISLGLVVFTARLGKEWMLGLVVIFLLIANLFASKLSIAFGVTTSLAVPIYASIFLATDAIAEHFGRREAFKAVWLGFLAQLCLAGFGLLLTRATWLEDPIVIAVSEALDTIFGFIPRIVAGSFLAYLLSQHFDVWFYHLLKARLKGRHLWLRNCVSTIISQGIDTAVFLLIAFYGKLPNLVEFILVTWFLKVLVAFCDTPFLYLTRVVVRKSSDSS